MAVPNATPPPGLVEPTETLLIDNFDSFTWNLYQYLCILGANVRVVRNDALTPEDFPKLNIKNLIISPGPGHPKTDSGISNDAIKYFAGKLPVLGVCMGLECVVDAYGGTIAYAGEIKHGKTSKVRHDGRGIFKGVPQGVVSTRYHSLSADSKTLPEDLAITAVTQESGVIMGVRHRQYTIEAVQYHPESIMSDGGDSILKNFLLLKGGTWEENPEFMGTTEPAILDDTNSKPPTILEKIYAQRIKDVEVAKATPGTTEADLNTLLSLHLAPPSIPLIPRLRARSPALMAEVKRASPSKGDIALGTNAAQQALTYGLAGASVISVLTEPTWFKGSLLDMRVARQAVDSLPNRPAILRKDFILDEYQIMEARLHGADTVLLIVAMLPPERLQALYSFSLSLGMEPLVEVNNATEMERAIELGAKVIGVNNRNLHDFQVDMGTTSRLATMCAEHDITLCALSGITGPEDVRGYVKEGVGAVLVGEALMRASDPAAFIRHLLDIPPAANVSPAPKSTLVKICGIRSKEHAKVAIESGADFIGLVFAPQSKRFVDVATAAEIVQYVRIGGQPLAIPPSSSAGNLPWFANSATRLEQSLKATKRPLLVGVFQGQSLEEIQHIVAAVQLDLVQLHGVEPAHWAKHIPVPIIRAFHLPAQSEANGSAAVGQKPSLDAGLREITRPGYNEFILLDAVRPGATLSGGAGVAVDWAMARTIVDGGEVPSSSSSVPPLPLPVILAGGLTPENVAEAVATVRPWAVDVSGGVETDKVKDPAKIRAFIAAVKGAPSSHPNSADFSSVMQ
ncbi:hypothetical protein DL93DRAFT_2074126 [Clavulina sp. PMI_390]|nr:hypothetical protein DL93DRAFT_2074126 [Clavulina sp. PMI_390]